MAKKRHKNFNVKRVGEIMEQMDTPHSEFDLGESFKENGAGGGGMKPSQPLLNAFQRSYEPVDSEHFASTLSPWVGSVNTSAHGLSPRCPTH